MKAIVLAAFIVLLSSNSYAATYYFSNAGSDSSDCMSTPCATIARLNNLDLKPGDTVRFRCQDAWRVAKDAQLSFKNGSEGNPITYSSFGDCSGANAHLHTSLPAFTSANHSNSSSDWMSLGGNIWLYKANGTSNQSKIGHVILNSTLRDFVFASGQNVLRDVNAPHEYHANTSGSHELYLYSVGNPADAYPAGIEIAYNLNGLSLESDLHDIIVENLSTRFTGKHGLYVNKGSNLEIRNMDISYFGGAYCCFANDLWGNGIEIWWNSHDVEVHHNRIYNGIDAGITSQATGAWMNGSAYNHHYHHNLVYNTGYGFELMFSDSSMSIRNITVDHNTFVDIDAGVFAEMRKNESTQPNLPMCLRVGETYDTFNFTFTNNICHASSTYVYGVMGLRVSNYTPQHIYNNNYIYRDVSRGFSDLFAIDKAKNRTYATCEEWKLVSGKDSKSLCGPYTLADFRPAPGSPLCTSASDGGTIGAIECLSITRGKITISNGGLGFRNGRLTFR